MILGTKIGLSLPNAIINYLKIFIMRTKIILSTLMSLFIANSFAQDRTTVNATNSEISDNLDLRAVASIFGDSRDLEDFESRLNDPKNQISNLDLNNDNQVDYLRVIESVEGNTHLIVLQSVLGKDTFQDVATVEVEKDSNNRIQVQVVGDVFMYGNNYIYEPVYVSTPIIYNHFWTPYYRPYYSSWYWGYYPSYYTYWSPFPIFRYRNHIAIHINMNHHYNYVNYRRCQVAYNNYYGNRANYYERQYPNRSFASRNSGYSNRYELDRTRNIRTVGSTRNDVGYSTPRNTNMSNPRSTTPRNYDMNTPRSSTPRNTDMNTPRSSTPRNSDMNTPRSSSPRVNSTPRNNDVGTPRSNPRSESPRVNTIPRNSQVSTPRNSSPRSEGSRGNSGSRSSESNSRSGNSGRR